MSGLAIRVENLGKRYRIGAKSERYQTLRDSFMNAITKTFSWHGEEHRSSFKDGSSNIIWALKDVSFTLQQGEVAGIVGRNGAGKSTLLKILSRITEPTTGEAQIYGRVGSLLEVGTGFHPELTGRENIYLNGAILGMRKAEIQRKFDEMVNFAEVEKFIDTPAKHYSSGMYMRLAFAVAAHLETEILFVDEVLAVGDIAFQKKCLGKISEVSKEGRTVLFVSHNLAAVQALCRVGLLLHEGQLQQVGHIQEVVNTYTRENYQRPENLSTAFPVVNQSYGIGITECSVRLEADRDGKLGLEIKLKVEASRPLRNIGVGLSITSIEGAKISWLGPSVTNYVIDELQDYCECVLYCPEIDRYLGGGDYVVGLWLSKPRIEYLVRVAQAALVSIPSRDIFQSGVAFDERYHGPVPLPFKFLTQ